MDDHKAIVGTVDRATIMLPTVLYLKVLLLRGGAPMDVMVVRTQDIIIMSVLKDVRCVELYPATDLRNVLKLSAVDAYRSGMSLSHVATKNAALYVEEWDILGTGVHNRPAATAAKQDTI